MGRIEMQTMKMLLNLQTFAELESLVSYIQGDALCKPWIDKTP